MHRSGGDFVVCCVRNERVALQFRCKVSLPTDSVCTSRTVRCGQVTFCKMMPHLAIRLVAAVHFVLGARVSKDAFFVSQLRYCHKKILTPAELTEEVTALHEAAQRQERWLHWNCCMDSSASTTLVQWHATWAAPAWHGTSWTGWWNAAAADQWHATAEWRATPGVLERDARGVAADTSPCSRFRARQQCEQVSAPTSSGIQQQEERNTEAEQSEWVHKRRRHRLQSAKSSDESESESSIWQ